MFSLEDTSKGLLSVSPIRIFFARYFRSSSIVVKTRVFSGGWGFHPGNPEKTKNTSSKDLLDDEQQYQLADTGQGYQRVGDLGEVVMVDPHDILSLKPAGCHSKRWVFNRNLRISRVLPPFSGANC